jgi:acyl-CoA thioesterase FadM
LNVVEKICRESKYLQAVDQSNYYYSKLGSCTHILNIIDISWKTNVVAWTRKYYLKNNYLTLRSNVKVPRRSLWYATHHLMVMHPHTKYHWPISKDKNVMARTRKYYLKNNYLTFRSNVKVPRRSLWYATHRLMVMHPHTKYHWPIWKDKKVMVRTSPRFLCRLTAFIKLL